MVSHLWTSVLEPQPFIGIVSCTIYIVYYLVLLMVSWYSIIQMWLLFDRWVPNLAIEEVDLRTIIATEEMEIGLETIYCPFKTNYCFLIVIFCTSEQLKVIYNVCLDNLQTHTCCSTFQPLLRYYIAIIGFVCHLLVGEGQGNLQDFCPIFCGTDNDSLQV